MVGVAVVSLNITRTIYVAYSAASELLSSKPPDFRFSRTPLAIETAPSATISLASTTA